MVKRYKGGLMGSTEAVTSTTDARGMWNAVQATQARNTGNWPALLTTETPGSGSGAGFANGFMTVSNVAVTDSSYTVLDDTPNISTSGGYIKLTGRGFVSGCVVYVGGVAATSTTFVSSTEVRAQIAAATSNTLMVYVVNPDGSTGIKLSSLVFSGTPSWVTGTTLNSQVTDVAFSLSFSATSDSAVTYTLNTGSSLPPGTTLYANGLFTGTVTGVTSDTTYSFSVVAIDAENQDTARTFSVTFATGDAYFYLTPLLLNGEANVWIRDSSVNNLLPAVGGDTKPSAFSPYNYNQSVYFDGTGDYLTVAANSAFAFGTGDFTVECWVNMATVSGTYLSFMQSETSVSAATNDKWFFAYGSSKLVFQTHASGGFTALTDWVPVANRWYHVAAVRQSGTMKLFVDGVSGTVSLTGTSSGYSLSQNGIAIGAIATPYYITGYISNARLVSGVAVYTGSFTVPTTKLANVQSSGTNISAITAGQTVLLTCQDARFVDNSGNAFTVTPNGDSANKSFGPLVETDTTSGSAYFDGSGDYLTIADNAGMELGAGDFSFECWVYTTTNSGTGIVIDKRTASYGPLLIWRNLGNLQLYMSGNGSSWSIVNGVTMLAMSINRWYHVAVYRVGSTVYYAINGAVATAATSSATPHNNSQTWYIGTETNASTNPWSGWICDMRFVVGSSPYGASNFTPPTTPLTAITNTQFLSLQYRTGENNHRFVDESGLRNIATRAGNASQGSFSPFSADDGYWSVSYPTNTQRTYATTSTSIINVTSTATFTVEGWMMLTGTAGSSHIMLATTDFGSTVNWYIGVDGVTKKPIIYWYTGSVVTCLGSTVLNQGQWYFLQFRASSGALSIGVNGVAETLTGTTTMGNPGNSTYLSFGCERSFASACSLYDIRISNTVRSYTLPTVIQSTDANTTFLGLRKRRIYDESSLATTLTGPVYSQPFSPFGSHVSPRVAYSPSTHGGSTYFDGSGDYVYLATNAAMTLGTNNHCIEFWMYPDGTQNAYSVIWSYATGASQQATNNYYLGIGTTSNGLLLGNGAAAWAVQLALTSPTDFNYGQWSHVVITRSGTAFRYFINGILKAYTTSSQSISAQSGSFSIGWDGATATTYYKGWLSNFRVINGSIPTAYQTSSTTTGTTIFTPPTSVPTFDANTVIQTNFTNAGIYDATGRNNFETLADAKISNVASKFGIGSLSFDGTGDYLYTSSTASLIYPGGLGDLTVEAWVYVNSLSANQTIFFINGNTTGFAGVRLDINATTGYLTLLVSTSGSAHAINSTSATGLAAGSWKHVAVVRSSGTFTVYIDAASVITSTAVGATTAVIAGSQHVIGAHQNTTYQQNFNGYLDDLRITRYARTITLPTTAHLTR